MNGGEKVKEYIERAAVHELLKRLPKYQMFSYDRAKSIMGINPDDVDFGVDKIPAASIISSGGSTPNAAPAFLMLAGYGSCSPRSQRLICIAHIPHLSANFCFVSPEPLYRSKSHFAAGFMLLPPAPCERRSWGSSS